MRWKTIIVVAALMGHLSGERLPAPQSAPILAADDLAQFEDGDIIFRRGRSLLSHMVLLAEAQTSYSHVGLVVETEAGLRVVHAAPGEHLRSTAPLRVEPLTAFLAPEVASAAALFRVAKPRRRAHAAAQAARRYARRGVLFDAAFDLASRDAMYCTEMVWRAYQDAGLDLVDGAFDRLALHFGDGLYILPERLARSRHVSQVALFPASS